MTTTKYEQKDMRGSLFRVEEKKSDKSPDMSGSIKIKGVVYRLSGWTETAKSNGKKYLSLSATEDENSPTGPAGSVNQDDGGWGL